MSLVEQALKKLHEAQGTSATPSRSRSGASPILGTPVSETRVEVSAPPARPVVRTPPARTVRLDREALRAAAILPPTDEERRLASQYRHIKRPLVERAFGHSGERLERGRLIMVASALPGEGKTFTSIHLAMSMALEPDLSVVLVDADVARCKLSHTFGVEHDRGLLDVLRDENADIESIILPTDVPRLSIVSSGTRSETATELLASHRMQQVLADLCAADPHRIVIFDSSPLLLTSESRALANAAGQIVMIVRAESTSQRAVLDAVQLLGEGKPIGLVLNQCEPRKSVGDYPYYGTEYGSEENSTTSK